MLTSFVKRALALVGALAVAASTATAADAAAARALVVGIDSYSMMPALRGAVADARDIARSLAAIGVHDAKVLLDADATRSQILASLQAVADRTQPGDTVFLAIACYGAKDAARGDMMLLPAFDPGHPDVTPNRVLISEVTALLKRVETAGGQVVFISDTGFGEGVPRDVDPRTSPPSYRTLQLAPGSKPRSVGDDGARPPIDLHHTFWVAAADDRDRAPEVNLPGIGYRGALSYAFARALDGNREETGVLTTSALLPYLRQVVHQMSDQRQVVAVNADSSLRLDVEPRGRARGISVRPVEPKASTSSGFTIAPVIETADSGDTYEFGASAPNASGPAAPLIGLAAEAAPEAPAVLNVQAPAPAPPLGGAPIKLASLDGGTAYFKGLQGQEPVVFVAPNASPDLTWDPRTRDVLAGSDVIASNVDTADLAGVVERSLALAVLKQKGTMASQPITLLPSDDRHTKGTRIEIEVGELTNRYLVLFNLSGNGNVQLLYPLGSDPPQRRDPKYSVEFQVREPFGADHVVAVTSSQRMAALETFLKQTGRRLKSDRLAEELSRRDAQNMRVGFVGLFTMP